MGEGVQPRGSPRGFGEAFAGERAEALPAEEVDRGADLLSWLSQNRRLSKDYERLPENSEAFIYVAMSRLMARRLARS
jgi:transposase